MPGATADWVVVNAHVQVGAAAGVMGQVVVRCPIYNPMDAAPVPPWNNWEITYNDPDGAGMTTRVRLWLCEVDKFAPFVTACFPQMDSDAVGVAGLNYVAGPVAGPILWNFALKTYFARIALNDAAGGTTPVFVGTSVF